MTGGKRGIGGRGAVTRRTSVPPAATSADRRTSLDSPNFRGHGSTSGLDSASEADCGTCRKKVGDDAVGCDKCDSWFHPLSMCLGLPVRVIKDIVELKGDGILFVCLSCRVNKRISGGRDVAGNADQGDTIKQLSEMVMALCATVQTLSQKVDSLLSQGITSHTLPAPHDRLSTRQIIREEMRELQDRERRKDSVILRGMTNMDVSGVESKFKEISTFLITKEVVLAEVVCLNQDKGLYRGKIMDAQDRRTLLQEAHKLKHSRFSDVFLHRDLTFQQRQELSNRRANQRGASAADGAAADMPSPVVLPAVESLNL